MRTWYSLLITTTTWLLVNPLTNNVCKTFLDYSTIESNKNCWYNPDIDSTPPDIAERYGYHMEKYSITTKDGYILTLFRIPQNRNDSNFTRQPILMQHGIGASAIFWLMHGKNSLPFVLANNGYDVWLSTSRGSGDSRKHVHLTTEDPLYWNFGLHELGIYDVPANIEFISNITGQKGNIIYIGHSMGTTMSYIYSSVKRNHARSNLKAIISLSPVAYLKHIEGFHKFVISLLDVALPVLQNLGISYIGDMPLVNDIIYSFCKRYPGILLCQAISLAFTGISPEQIKADLFVMFLKYYPTGISLKVLTHYIQIIMNGGMFRYYDYKHNNMLVYKSTTPPEYNVTRISVPVYFFIGTQDTLASDRDVNILYNKLNSSQSKAKVSKYFVNFAHNDYFIGADLRNFYYLLSDLIKNKIKDC